MSMRTPQDCGFIEITKWKIIDEFPLTGKESWIFPPDHTSANICDSKVFFNIADLAHEFSLIPWLEFDSSSMAATMPE